MTYLPVSAVKLNYMLVIFCCTLLSNPKQHNCKKNYAPLKKAIMKKDVKSKVEAKK